MKKEIDKKIKELQVRLKEATHRYKEWDNHEDLHMMAHIKFAIEEFNSFKKSLRDEKSR